MAAMKSLVASHPGVKPLSLQWMQRQRNSDGDVEEHFGFVDGTSNPVLSKSQSRHALFQPRQSGRDPVRLSEPGRQGRRATRKRRHAIRALLHDGSFLVMRKLRQDIEALDKASERCGQAQATAAGQALTTRSSFMAKMMGRWPGGHPNSRSATGGVLSPPDSNDFHFDNDPDGAVCPFHAHIRRANPRIGIPKPAAGRPASFVGACPTARRSVARSRPAEAARKPRSGARADLHGLQCQSRRAVRSWCSAG